MRKLRRLSMALVFTLALSGSALAGIIGGGPEPPPPPPEPPSATATGIIGTSPSAEPIDPATDPVVDVALDLIQSVLSLF